MSGLGWIASPAEFPGRRRCPVAAYASISAYFAHWRAKNALSRCYFLCFSGYEFKISGVAAQLQYIEHNYFGYFTREKTDGHQEKEHRKDQNGGR